MIIYDILLIFQYHVSTTVMDLIVVFCIVSCLYLCLRCCVSVSLPNFRRIKIYIFLFYLPLFYGEYKLSKSHSSWKWICRHFTAVAVRRVISVVELKPAGNYNGLQNWRSLADWWWGTGCNYCIAVTDKDTCRCCCGRRADYSSLAFDLSRRRFLPRPAAGRVVAVGVPGAVRAGDRRTELRQRHVHRVTVT